MYCSIITKTQLSQVLKHLGVDISLNPDHWEFWIDSPSSTEQRRYLGLNLIPLAGCPHFSSLSCWTWAVSNHLLCMHGGSRCSAGKCHRTARKSKQTVLPHCLCHCREGKRVSNQLGTQICLCQLCLRAKPKLGEVWPMGMCLPNRNSVFPRAPRLLQGVPHPQQESKGIAANTSPECRKKDLGHLFHLLLALHLKIFPAH